jgi:Uma2 family endonuclease
MAEAFSWSWLGQAALSPEVTLDVWLDLPEEVCRHIEVENGRIIHCESASPSHQAVQYNLQTALLNATKKSDADTGQCHRVRAELDVLFTEVPFHYRKPDVVVYRCVPTDQRLGTRWQDKPLASDTLITVEVVSRSTVIEDLQTKRSLYAKAGIPHYWVVRMAGDNGVAVSVERLALAADGSYVTEGLAVRDKDLYAVDTLNPFHIQVSWNELDLDV